MKRPEDHHEFGGRAATVETSSDRSFGLVFAGFFALLGGYGAWRGAALWPLWLAIAAVFLVLALLRPGVLSPLNYLWSKLGQLMGMVVSPIVLALMFFVVVTPVALLMRLFGKDPLRLRRDAGADSYWIAREPPGPPGDSMRDQF